MVFSRVPNRHTPTQPHTHTHTYTHTHVHTHTHTHTHHTQHKHTHTHKYIIYSIPTIYAPPGNFILSVHLCMCYLPRNQILHRLYHIIYKKYYRGYIYITEYKYYQAISCQVSFSSESPPARSPEYTHPHTHTPTHPHTHTSTHPKTNTPPHPHANTHTCHGISKNKM